MAKVQKTVLIVQDDVALLRALKERCEMEDFGMLTAQDGEEGLKIALEHHPDIILVDIVMPKMDGLQMIEELRKDAWGKEANVIILTNSTENRYVANAVKHGVHDYIILTQWDPNDVIERVRLRLGLPPKTYQEAAMA